MVLDCFQQHFQIFLIIFMRVFGLVCVLPILANNIPNMAKTGFCFFIALLSTPLIVSFNSMPIDKSILDFAMNLLSSFIIGLSVGFMAHLTVSAIQLSSNIFSTTMGLTFSENISPLTQESIPALGNFLSVIVLLLFIRTESHIVFIEIIVRSFQDLPVIQISAAKGIFIAMKTLTSMIFVLAFRISLPIIAVTLLLDLAMGMIGRVAPQFNIMIMGWNIKILISFTILWIILPTIMDLGIVIFHQLYESVQQFLKIAHQG